MNKYVIFVFSHVAGKTDVWQVEGEMMLDAYVSAFTKYYQDDPLPETYSEIERMFWDAEFEFTVWEVR